MGEMSLNCKITDNVNYIKINKKIRKGYKIDTHKIDTIRIIDGEKIETIQSSGLISFVDLYMDLSLKEKRNPMCLNLDIYSEGCIIKYNFSVYSYFNISIKEDIDTILFIEIKNIPPSLYLELGNYYSPKYEAIILDNEFKIYAYMNRLEKVIIGEYKLKNAIDASYTLVEVLTDLNSIDYFDTTFKNLLSHNKMWMSGKNVRNDICKYTIEYPYINIYFEDKTEPSQILYISDFLIMVYNKYIVLEFYEEGYLPEAVTSFMSNRFMKLE